MVFYHNFTQDNSTYFFLRNKRKGGEIGHRNPKKVAQKVETVSGKGVSKQHFMAAFMFAAMFYNNGTSLQKVNNMLEIINFTEFMSSYCLARCFIEFWQQLCVMGKVQAQVINYSLEFQFMINKKPKPIAISKLCFSFSHVLIHINHLFLTLLPFPNLFSRPTSLLFF